MGLTKQYLRYAACGVFNVIGSSSANVVFIEFKGVKGKLCAVGACEHVFIWDLRKGEKVKLFYKVSFMQITFGDIYSIRNNYTGKHWENERIFFE